jgi:hypothetical protein
MTIDVSDTRLIKYEEAELRKARALRCLEANDLKATCFHAEQGMQIIDLLRAAGQHGEPLDRLRNELEDIRKKATISP